MLDATYEVSLAILIFGGLIVGAILVRAGLRGVGVPPLIGFVVLGLALGAADSRWDILSPVMQSQFEFVAELGIFALLFRIGLESNLRGLLQQLPRALLIWVVNVVLSGGAGYFVARHLLGIALIPSLFVAIALTATSIGIMITIWREAGAMRSRNGALLTDVAELDDLSAILLMLLLLNILPIVGGTADGSIIAMAGATVGLTVLKVVLFGAGCFLFSQYMERPITRLMSRLEPMPAPMLMMIGIGLAIAALAGLLGFSLAIGALFAGLVFSRDPEAVRVDASFDAIHDMLVPFFFIGIGLQIDLASLPLGLGLGGALLAAAVLGKVVGAGGPALLTSGAAGAALIGVSMVPRAEIAMVVAREGRKLGDWAVPPEVYSALIFITLVTCLLTPLVLRWMLARWPQQENGDDGDDAPEPPGRSIDARRTRE